MRALVDAAALAGSERMRLAAAGLARRGHLVIWHGAQARAPHPGPNPPAQLRADVVLGSAQAPLRTAWLGWKAGAHCMVLALEAERVRRWGLLQRLACSSMYAAGMVETGERDAMRALASDIELDRIGLWSEEPPPPEPDPAHPDTEWLERACERALARHRGRAPRPAVFLDRDGTIVVERGYLSDPDEIELLPGVARALRSLKAAGYPLVVVSNQSGVGRGLFPESRVHEAMARVREALRAESVELDAIYFCPHRPEEGCACRKPGTALLERAADDLLLSLRRSAMVGDKRLDVETAHRAGALGVLVRTGYGRDEEQREGEATERAPDAVCDDVAAAARWILERGEAGDD
jgi:histidinol-phosphate phosphatase family protein